MNLTVRLNTARRELGIAKVHAEHDGKTAKAARKTAIAAKQKLKQTRKLVKFTRKIARKAEDHAELALEKLEQARARVEKLEKRARKEARKQKLSAAAKAPAQTAPRLKPAPAKIKKLTRPILPRLPLAVTEPAIASPADASVAVIG